MRHILVDWLVDVHMKFKLGTQTLFMAVNLVDRALELMEILKTDFQLLGIACLFMASKFEEIYPPQLKEFVYVCADAYSGDQILCMEERVLAKLRFNLVFSSAYSIFKMYGSKGRA